VRGRTTAYLFFLSTVVILSAFLCVSSCKKSLGPPPPEVKYYNFMSHFEETYIFGRAQLIDIGSPEAKRFLDEGWHKPEVTESGFTYSYSRGKRSEFHFDAAGTGPYKMAIRAKAFTFPASPAQQVTVSVNGKKIGEVTLEREFSVPVIDIPSDALKEGRNKAVLDFAWARSPKEVLPGSNDRRLFSAMFDLIVIFRDEQELTALTERGGPELKIIGTRVDADKQAAMVFPVNSAVRFTEIQLADQSAMKFTWGILGSPPKGVISFEVKWLGESGEKVSLYNRKIRAGEPPGQGRSANIDLGFLGKTKGNVEFRVDFDPRDKNPPLLFVTSAGLFAKLPNVVLIVADALRSDRLGCYGGPVHTPNLDRLAKEGTLFEYAYTTYPATPPSFASIFTGKLPIHHGLRSIAGTLDGREKTVTRIVEPLFSGKAGFASLSILHKPVGIFRGFDTYLSPAGTACWKWTARKVNEAALPWIREHSKENFFLFLHYADPHGPYAAPGSVNARLVISLDENVIFDNNLTYHECVQAPVYLTPGEHRLTLRVQHPAACEYKSAENPDGKLKYEVLRVTCLLGKEGGVSIKHGVENWGEPKLLNEIELPLEKPVEIIISLEGSEPATKTFEFMPQFWGGGGRNGCHGGDYLKTYDREVAYLDEQIGILLDTLRQEGVLESTVIVFTADHGEEFNEHGFVGHVEGLYEQSLHVPLMWRAPWIFPRGKRIGPQVRTIDIAPTLLDILGMQLEEKIDGVSLLPLVKGNPLDLPAIAENQPVVGGESNFSLRHGEWHLIMHPGKLPPELYNTQEDPDEQNNVARDNMAVVNRMKSELEALISEEPHVTREVIITPEMENRLRAMGYLK